MVQQQQSTPPSQSKDGSVSATKRFYTYFTFYDSAIHFVRLATEQIDAGNSRAASGSLQTARAIIVDLSNLLDHVRQPELSGELEQLYWYLNKQLSLAEATADTEPLDRVMGYLADLKEVWALGFERGSNWVSVNIPPAPEQAVDMCVPLVLEKAEPETSYNAEINNKSIG